MEQHPEVPSSEGAPREEADVPSEAKAGAPRDEAAEGASSGGTLQLRFVGLPFDGDSLDVRELSDSMQGLAELVADFAKAGALGIDGSPEVRVRPAQRGSFIAEMFILAQWVDPQAVGAAYQAVAPAVETAYQATATTGVVGAGIRAAIGKFRNNVTDVTEFGRDQAKIQFRDGTVETVPMAIWEELSREKVATKRALRKLMAPLRDDADGMEVRAGSNSDAAYDSEPIVTATHDDYLSVATDIEVEEHERDFDVSVTFDRVDTKDPKKWRITVAGESTRGATMGDDRFFREVANGSRTLNFADEYDVKLHEVSSSPNGRLRRDWTVTEVVRVRSEGTDGIDGS